MSRTCLAVAMLAVGCSFPTGEFRLDAGAAPADAIDVVADDHPAPDVAPQDLPPAVDAWDDVPPTDVPPTDDASDDGGLACSGTQLLCDGACVDTATSVAHCGACGHRCDADGGAWTCVAGVCAPSCAAGSADCDGDPANGCETDLQTSALHCGRCGGACNNANGTPSCASGRCAIECVDGFGDCDGDPANGCETSLDAPASCGRCGNDCGTGSCVAGACMSMCSLTRCGAACVDTQTSAAHCGACDRACATPNASPRCAAGACAIGACAAGFADCDRDPRNGCEVNTTSDASNCGACGTRCAFANGTGACVGGRCGLAGCTAGFANCNGNAADGCETNVRANVSNCGRCGVVCTAPTGRTPVCVDGLCGSVAGICPRGTADCDGNAVNGCETNVLTSGAHCGGCGLSCARPNATTACAAGTCTLSSCAAGYANCDGNLANGCESPLATDVTNCGRCGNYCRMVPGAGTPSCTASQCTPTCAAGYANCDGNPVNGCETALNTNAHCGGCGRACGAGRTCSNGTCAIFPVSLGSYALTALARPGPTFLSACGAAGRTVILPNQDDAGQLVPLPFAFRFWNVSYAAGAMLNVSTNGWLGFEPVVRNNLRGLIPDPAIPNAVVAPFWTDLVVGPGGICVATVGAAPYRVFVVEWADAVFFRDRNARVRFEAVLFESSNEVRFYYDTLPAFPVGENITVGLEHPNGQFASVHTSGANACTLTSGERLSFVPN